MKKTRGFTLIELLVVISVIGLLSTIILGSLQQARSKGRNSTRKQTLVSMRTALELFYSNSNVYPSTAGVWFSSESGDVFSNNGGNWVPGLVAARAISVLPRDPQGGVATNPACAPPTRRAYLYVSTNGSGYKLLSHCAPEGTWPATDPFFDSPGNPIRPTHAWMICRGTDCAL